MQNHPNLPEKYKALKLLGQGSFGKAYLVEGETSHVIDLLLTIILLYRKPT